MSADSKICPICSVSFDRRYDQTNIGWGKQKYCSMVCKGRRLISQSKNCDHCAKIFYRKKMDKPALWGKRRFCNQECYANSMTISLENRITQNSVRTDDGCLTWKGPVCRDGNPRTTTTLCGSQRLVRAIYQSKHGKLKRHEHVVQTCFNKLCVDENHLAAVRTSRSTGIVSTAPVGFRKNIRTAQKLEVVLMHGNVCHWCSKPVTRYEDSQFDHDPPVMLREWDHNKMDTIPAFFDLRYIKIMHSDCHAEKTTRDRRAIFEARTGIICEEINA